MRGRGSPASPRWSPWSVALPTRERPQRLPLPRRPRLPPAPPSTSAVVPVTVPARTGDIGPTAAAELAPIPVEVAYGPDPMHRMDVYATSGDSLGTIMYIHGGGWNGGSKDANTAPLVLSTQGDLRDTASPLLADVDETAGERLIFAQIQNGWDVVSIDYRLATAAPGPGIRAAEILNDVDRAVRYTRAHAAELGLNMHKFVLAGGSAGGHLALMETAGRTVRTRSPTRRCRRSSRPPIRTSTRRSRWSHPPTSPPSGRPEESPPRARSPCSAARRT